MLVDHSIDLEYTDCWDKRDDSSCTMATVSMKMHTFAASGT